jgi:hypothetical protein
MPYLPQPLMGGDKVFLSTAFRTGRQKLGRLALEHIQAEGVIVASRSSIAKAAPGPQ